MKIEGQQSKNQVKTQAFDKCDCPYQINEFIGKHKIRLSQIINFSHYENEIIMYYRS